jgi:hypothetical protein
LFTPFCEDPSRRGREGSSQNGLGHCPECAFIELKADLMPEFDFIELEGDLEPEFDFIELEGDFITRRP